MAINWDLIKTRLSTRGQDGNLLLAITGNETDEELRELVMCFTEECPAQLQRSDCPFRKLHHLYHGSLKSLVNGMTRKALQGMFELECEVRNTNAPASCLQADGELAIKSEATP